ncbi:MAG: hypothetical protein ACP5N1_04865 [Candidatus Woesearchaeota archaeon]
MDPNNFVGNHFTPSIDKLLEYSKLYLIPEKDLFLMSLNIDGVSSEFSSNRLRFKLNIGENFFVATSNSNTHNKTPWEIQENKLYLYNTFIGDITNLVEDVCDNTYFRRFIEIDGHEFATAITLNSNSRSSCNGCQFCGTYTLKEKDIGDNDLTIPSKLVDKLNVILPKDKNYYPSMKDIIDVGIVTGCFSNEKETVDHILMINDVLKNSLGFNGLLKYVGSQIRSKDALDMLNATCDNFGYYFTLECFDRRDELLKPSKRVSLEQTRKILSYAKDIGIKTNILYILGLDPLESLQNNIVNYRDCLSAFPIVNTMQDYSGKQFLLRDKQATNIEYYIHARKIFENTFNNFIVPNVWENYRGIFFTEFNGKKIDSLKI